MNTKLFKANTRSNLVMFLIFLGLMLMYLSMITSMFDPKSAEDINALLSSLPEQLAKAVGFTDISSNLTGFLGNMYYGFIAVMFPMIYCILLGNKLMAKQIENGSMSYLLSTPNSRSKIAVTQALYLLGSTTLLVSLVTLCGIGISNAMFGGLLDTGKFISLNTGLLLLFYAISGICFFFSCLFNESSSSLVFGAGIPVLFFVMKMLANAGNKFSWISNFTLLSLFDPAKILAGDSFAYLSWIILGGIAVVLYAGGIIVFNKKDLPL